MLTLQEKLRRQRVKVKLTQQEVADRLGISRGAYVTYERGYVEPRKDILEKIADLFNVDLAYFLENYDLDENSPDDYVDYVVKSAAINQKAPPVLKAINLANEINGLFSGGEMKQTDMELVMNILQVGYLSSTSSEVGETDDDIT